MQFKNETEFEKHIRNLITTKVTSCNNKIFALSSKKAVDIVVCKEGPKPKLYFLEVKYHMKHHGRLGFGGKNGDGFQPEVLMKRPSYLEKNLRWVISSENCDKFYFLDNTALLKYVSGGVVGKKFNNIQVRLFEEEEGLCEEEFVSQLKKWLSV